MPARDLGLEQQWRERIERLGQCGLTAVKFAQQEGVPVHQVTWWRRELKRRDSASDDGTAAVKKSAKKKQKKTKPPTKSADFVAVSLAPSPSTTAPIEIVLDTPPRIVVSAEFDPGLLREVLRVMENGAC